MSDIDIHQNVGDSRGSVTGVSFHNRYTPRYIGYTKLPALTRRSMVLQRIISEDNEHSEDALQEYHEIQFVKRIINGNDLSTWQKVVIMFGAALAGLIAILNLVYR